jgi:uncharacterized protein
LVLGVAGSRTVNTIYSPNLHLNKRTLEGLYNDDGIAQRIVEAVVADSLKGFINGEVELLEELKRLQAKQKIYEAGTFGRLFGGALLVAFVDDGQELSKPLNQQKIHKIVSLQIYDRYQVSFEDHHICQDIYAERFNQPTIYKINHQERNIAMESQYFEVHHSPLAKRNNNGFDASVLQACYNSIRNYGIVSNTSVEIVQDFVQPILKMSGLSDKASSGELDAVKRRLEVIDRSRSSQNTIMLDSESGEEYTKLPSGVSGLSDLWEKFAETICATTGIPASRLFGRSPAGLNSSGENDIKNWHDIVSSYREDQIEPCLRWLIEMLQNQHSWDSKPSTFYWTFPALNNPSELELAEIKKKYAEIDVMYADRGGIDISEAWHERFGTGEFQRDINLRKPEDNDIEEDILAQQEAN